MTPEQIDEAMRLASVFAMKRVRRYAIQKGSSLTTFKTANESVERARAELRAYLQTVSTGHTTEGEKHEG